MTARLRARWVVPRAGDVIVGGHVAWAGAVLLEVGTGAPAGVPAPRDCGDAVILPGLVNAHAHLELTALRGRVPRGTGFADWVGRVVAARRATAEPDLVRGAAAGAAEAIAAGTVAVGDIVSIDACLPAVRASGLRGNAYLEILGTHPAGVADVAARLRTRLEAADALPGALAIGASPHAPWSTDAARFRAAAMTGRPLAVHVGETAEEIRFCLRGDGPLADLLRAFGAPVPPPSGHGRPVLLLEALGCLGPRTLCVHANHVDASEIAALAAARAPVAYCPRSHAFFGHPPHPIRALRAAGVPVALGTDSLASNDSLSMLDEVAFLAGTRGDLAPDDVLDCATRGGAVALGTGPGVLVPGAPADLTVVALPPGGDPLERLAAGEGEAILTVAGGRVLHDPRGLLGA